VNRTRKPPYQSISTNDYSQHEYVLISLRHILSRHSENRRRSFASCTYSRFVTSARLTYITFPLLPWLFSTQRVITSPLSQNTMTQSPLPKSFNPFIDHPFTNGSGIAPRSALPPPYPAPLPSRHVQTYHPKTFSYPLSDSSSAASTDSNPSSRSSTPMHSPKARTPSMVSPPASRIFDQVRKDATTPELVLKKRLPVSNVASRPK
jgi:hypothetical protein